MLECVFSNERIEKWRDETSWNSLKYQNSFLSFGGVGVFQLEIPLRFFHTIARVG